MSPPRRAPHRHRGNLTASPLPRTPPVPRRQSACPSPRQYRGIELETESVKSTVRALRRCDVAILVVDMTNGLLTRQVMIWLVVDMTGGLLTRQATVVPQHPLLMARRVIAPLLAAGLIDENTTADKAGDSDTHDKHPGAAALMCRGGLVPPPPRPSSLISSSPYPLIPSSPLSGLQGRPHCGEDGARHRAGAEQGRRGASAGECSRMHPQKDVFNADGRILLPPKVVPFWCIGAF